MIGQPVTMPVALAPVGMCGMNHADGEILAARAAGEFGVPYHAVDHVDLLDRGCQHDAAASVLVPALRDARSGIS